MQRKTVRTLAVLLAGAATYTAITAVNRRREQIRDAAGRWHIVTVNRPFMEVTDLPQLPDPLETISDIAAIDMRPTPDMSCTEIAVRLHNDYEYSNTALRRVRTALRTTQMLLEAGEIITPDAGHSTEPTVWKAPLRYLTKYRYGEGRL